MNDTISLITSITLGIIMGVVYGSLYLFSKKRVLSAIQEAPSSKDLCIIYGSALGRIGFVAALVYFLLLYPSIPFILTIACFLASFWCIIYIKKAH